MPYTTVLRHSLGFQKTDLNFQLHNKMMRRFHYPFILICLILIFVVPVSAQTWLKVAAGGYHTLALKSDGTVWAWGYNSYGQLGTGAGPISNVPVQVPGLANITDIGAGLSFSLAVGSGGTVYAWGRNNLGQLGNGTYTNSSSPVQVSGLTGVVSVSGGQGHCAALTSQGRVYTWGYNINGQLGNGSYNDNTQATMIAGLTDISSIAVGYNQTMALSATGTLYIWGYNGYGQLGSGNYNNRPSPAALAMPSGVTVSAVSARGFHTMVIGSDQKLYSFGRNDYGQLGNGSTTQTNTVAAINLPAGVSPVQIHANYYHSMMLGSDGKLYSWGRNDDGQLGLGNNTQVSSPSAVTISNRKVVAIGSGIDHSFFLANGRNEIYMTGTNAEGELGDGTNVVSRNVFTLSRAFFPPVVSGLNGDVVAWAGIGNTVALDAGPQAGISYPQFDDLGTAGDYTGATLTVQRKGGAVSSDVFVFAANGNFTVSGNNLRSGGQTFASFTNVGGIISITFNSAGTTATRGLVESVIRNISYRSDFPAGNATIAFALTDGTTTASADVGVTANDIYVTTSSDATTINPGDGVSFSEAFAISALQSGSQTIHLTSVGLDNQTISLAAPVSIAKDTRLRFGQNNSLASGGLNIAAGATLDIEQALGTLTVSSPISGSGSLHSHASGTIALRGNNSNAGKIRAYSGILNITAANQLPILGLDLDGGQLDIGSAITVSAPIGILSGSGISTGASTTLSGVVSGSGKLTKSGIGTLTLSASNTLTGELEITAGSVSTSSAANLPSGTVHLNGGGLLSTGTFTVNGPVRVSGNGGSNISVGSGALTLSGAISGTGNLSKLSTGTLILSGANTASGTLKVEAGVLSIGSASNLPSGTLLLSGGSLTTTAAISIGNPITLEANASLNLGGDLSLGGAITGNYNLHRGGNGTLTLSGSNSFGSLSLTGTVSVAGQENLPTGTIALNSGSTLTITSAGSIANGITLVGGTPTISTLANVTLAGSITQASNGAGLNKSGTGRLTLSGGSGHSGPTAVLAGTLVVEGSLGSTSGMTVASGATLGGSGSIFAAGSANTVLVLSGGTLAPTGNLRINGLLNLNNGSTFSTAITGNMPGSGYGNVSVSGSATLSSPNISVGHNYVPTGVDTYVLIDKTSTGTISGNFSGLAEGGTITASGNSMILKASYQGGNGNDFTLSSPEPVLPVQFISFAAKREHSAIRLDWKTASETNSRSFIVGRSTDGRDFTTIATVPAKGNATSQNSYTSYDRMPVPGKSYYRLIQVDVDGKQAELDIQSVDFDLEAKDMLTLAPVPAQTFTMASFPLGTSRLELVDITGRIVQKMEVHGGSDKCRIDMGGLAQGVYFVKCYGSYGAASAKLLKRD